MAPSNARMTTAGTRCRSPPVHPWPGIFFPRYSGVRPTMSPGDEHRQEGEDQHAIEA